MEADDSLVREVFAHFGLAYYLSEVVHRELCNEYSLAGFLDPSDVTKPRIDEKLAYAFSLTLGQLSGEMKPYLTSEVADQLDAALELRNFLAHDFWFERVHLMVTNRGCLELCDELSRMAHEFEQLDAILSDGFEERRKSFGITDDLLSRSLQSVLEGDAKDLPSRQKLPKQITVIGAWDVPTSNGKELVFESDLGALWQLCDVGLVWASAEAAKPDREENSVITPYLPFTINPRPKISAPWEYEFNIGSGATLWVTKPTKRAQFRWGVRTRKRAGPRSQ